MNIHLPASNPKQYEKNNIQASQKTHTVIAAAAALGTVCVQSIIQKAGAGSTKCIRVSQPATHFGTYISQPVFPGIHIRVQDNDQPGQQCIVTPVASVSVQYKDIDRKFACTIPGGYPLSVIPDAARLQSVNYLYNMILDSMDNKDIITPAPTNALPTNFQGDFTIRAVNGATGFNVGKFLYTIQAAKFCSLQLSQIDCSVHTLSMRYSNITPQQLQIYQSGVYYNLLAGSQLQPLGIIEGQQSTPVRDRYWKEYASQHHDAHNTFSVTALNDIIQARTCSGFYRYNTISSSSLYGYWHTVCIPAVSKATTYCPTDNPANNTFTALFTKHIGDQGAQLTQAAHSIVSIKTNKVSGVIYSDNYSKDIDQQKDIIKYTNALTAQQRIRHSSLLRQFQYTFAQLQSNLRDNLVKKVKQNYQTIQKNSNIAYKVRPLVGKAVPTVYIQQQQQINQLPVSQIIDNDSQRAVKQYIKNSNGLYADRYNSTSFIAQQPDGSIVIKDGYGSQIRMVRGNIIISSALDTYVRPGRHLIGIVPGNYKTTANSVQLASRKNTAIGAGTDMALAAGLSQSAQCSLTLQARKNSTVNVVANKAIVCRTPDLYVSAFSAYQASVTDKCNVTVDCKRGFMRVLGANGTIYCADSFTAVVGQRQQGTNSVLQLYPQKAVIGSSSMYLVANNIVAPNQYRININIGYTGIAYTVYNQNKDQDSTTIAFGKKQSADTQFVCAQIMARGCYLYDSIIVKNTISAQNIGSVNEPARLIKIDYPRITENGVYRQVKDFTSYVYATGVQTKPVQVVTANSTIAKWVLAQDTDMNYAFSLQDVSGLFAGEAGLVIPQTCWQYVAPYKLTQPFKFTSYKKNAGTQYQFPGSKAWTQAVAYQTVVCNDKNICVQKQNMLQYAVTFKQ